MRSTRLLLRPSLIRTLSVLATVATPMTLAGTARATPDFPDVVKATVGATKAPDCIVCHNNELGGLGTATTTFGTYMRARHVVAYDEDSLKNALAAAQGEKHDSDGDGIDDYDALKMGLDPNGTNGAEPPIEYGCLGRVAPGHTANAGATSGIALGIVAVGMILVRRKRRGRV